jgi:thiamine-monophosphate kinase
LSCIFLNASIGCRRSFENGYSDHVPLSEKRLITQIRRNFRPSGTLIVGVGDDSAVQRVARESDLLITTDFSLEGVHFRREWHPAEVVGSRCVVRGLSDIAAMGGEPKTVFLSLALPRALPQRWVDGFMRGLLQTAAQFKAVLAGGDTAESPHGVCVDIVVTGYVPKGHAVLRSGARPGDEIFVTGALGGSAAALREFFAGRKPRPRDFPRHFAPIPRVAVGRFLREKGLASSMIDLSDGFSTDLDHICEESGVGAEITAAAIPRAQVGRKKTAVDFRFALNGGEDYELLFTSSKGKPVPARIANVPITRIGQITRRKQVVLIAEDGSRQRLRPQGWEHFR